MPGPQPPARPIWRWTSEQAVTAVVCLLLLAAAPACTRGSDGSGGQSILAAVTDLEQGHGRRTVTVAGTVTDDDPSLDQTLVADDTRGILVLKAPWKTRPEAGSRVVLEGRLALSAVSYTHLTLPTKRIV